MIFNSQYELLKHYFENENRREPWRLKNTNHDEDGVPTDLEPLLQLIHEYLFGAQSKTSIDQTSLLKDGFISNPGLKITSKIRLTLLNLMESYIDMGLLMIAGLILFFAFQSSSLKTLIIFFVLGYAMAHPKLQRWLGRNRQKTSVRDFINTSIEPEIQEKFFTLLDQFTINNTILYENGNATNFYPLNSAIWSVENSLFVFSKNLKNRSFIWLGGGYPRGIIMISRSAFDKCIADLEDTFTQNAELSKADKPEIQKGSQSNTQKKPSQNPQRKHYLKMSKASGLEIMLDEVLFRDVANFASKNVTKNNPNKVLRLNKHREPKIQFFLRIVARHSDFVKYHQIRKNGNGKKDWEFIEKFEEDMGQFLHPIARNTNTKNRSTRFLSGSPESIQKWLREILIIMAEFQSDDTPDYQKIFHNK